jgi:hypothetical protein
MDFLAQLKRRKANVLPFCVFVFRRRKMAQMACSRNQGCQICLSPNIPNWEKLPNDHQMTTNYNKQL